jgi:hypothetical protein
MSCLKFGASNAVIRKIFQPSKMSTKIYTSSCTHISFKINASLIQEDSPPPPRTNSAPRWEAPHILETRVQYWLSYPSVYMIFISLLWCIKTVCNELTDCEEWRHYYLTIFLLLWIILNELPCEVKALRTSAARWQARFPDTLGERARQYIDPFRKRVHKVYRSFRPTSRFSAACCSTCVQL